MFNQLYQQDGQLTGDVQDFDLSRQEILESAFGEIPSFGPGLHFDFAGDANDGKTYGIDVSHHNGDINWKKVAGGGAKFVYIKATQGARHQDKRFLFNMENAIVNGIPAGAYHFMSSSFDALSQAEHFIQTYKAWHSTASLPPVLDIEWDFDENRNDKWKNKDVTEIVAMCSEWLEKVESELKVRPVIYTNKFWWEGLLGSLGDKFQSYDIWMSRYGQFDKSSPPLMDNFRWAVWQFTETGLMDGVNGYIDVNWCKPGFIPNTPDVTKIVTDAVPQCDLQEFKANNTPLSEEESKRLYTTLRGVFGGFTQEQVDFLNILIETAKPVDLREFLDGRYDPRLDETETAGFFSVAAELFEGSSAEIDTLKILLDLAQPSAVRKCILNKI